MSPRNPYYERIQRDGITVEVENPRGRHKRKGKPRNPYYERIKRGGIRIRTTPGRPKRSEMSAPTVTKSIRLPQEVWNKIDAQAAREGITRHAAARQALLFWLQV